MAQEDLDAFLNFANEKAETHKKNIDNDLYNFLLDSAEKLSALSDDEEDKMILIFKAIRENVETLDDLDKITEIYFYEGQYARTSREIQQTILDFATIYAEIFEDKNFEKIEEILKNNNEFKGNLALEFYLKIGLIDDHRYRILNFIKDSFDFLTDSQKQLCLHTLVKYKKDKTIQEILIKSGLFKYEKKKPWWKFW